jgi:hypothetical protein
MTSDPAAEQEQQDGERIERDPLTPRHVQKACSQITGDDQEQQNADASSVMRQGMEEPSRSSYVSHIYLRCGVEFTEGRGKLSPVGSQLSIDCKHETVKSIKREKAKRQGCR